jgi:hypothetical protein
MVEQKPEKNIIIKKSKILPGEGVLVHIEQDEGPDKPGTVVKVEPNPPLKKKKKK